MAEKLTRFKAYNNIKEISKNNSSTVYRGIVERVSRKILKAPKPNPYRVFSRRRWSPEHNNQPPKSFVMARLERLKKCSLCLHLEHVVKSYITRVLLCRGTLNDSFSYPTQHDQKRRLISWNQKALQPRTAGANAVWIRFVSVIRILFIRTTYPSKRTKFRRGQLVCCK